MLIANALSMRRRRCTQHEDPSGCIAPERGYTFHMNAREYGKLALCLLLPQAAGAVGALFTTPNIPTWYATLPKPALAPPNWVFGPVWTTLFLLMGIAAYLLWRRGLSRPGARLALSLFLVQLGLNVLWSALFFGMRNPAAAFSEIIVLWLAIAATIAAFYRVSRTAAALLVPYLLWVSFASYLNFGIAYPPAPPSEEPSLPVGYTIDSYSIATTTNAACTRNEDCKTPPEYLIRSSCPFTSLCIEKRCAVVCPQYAP